MKAALAIVFLTTVGSTLVAVSSAVGGEDFTRRSDSAQTYWVEQVAAGLQFPSVIAWLPNGDALIPERSGGLRWLRKSGELDPKPLNGAPARFQNIYNGLKDIAVDPDYQANSALYLLISEGIYDQHHAAVYRARYGRAGLDEVKRIFRSKDEIGGPGHSASRMLFLADKTLLIGIPENDHYKQMAQRLDSHIGKIVRINRDGSVPSDNPFLATAGVLPEIWSYGHRVPTGLYQDPATEMIWEIEPGPRGGDELNLLKAGGNFGWAKASWGFDYSGALAAPMQSAPGIENPILVWASIPSATPSGITRYRGTTYPAWSGDFFVGHLAGKALERLRLEGRSVVLRERMLVELEERIRDVKVGPDNHLYILTDHENGRVLRLQPGRPRATQLHRVAQKLRSTWTLAQTGRLDFAGIEPGDPLQGKQAFLERCIGCHRVGAEVQGGTMGPDLAGVYERKAGSAPGFQYSAALQGSPQVWDFMALNLFLADPGRYAPGTSMAAPPVTDPEVRRQIVGFLKHQSGK